MDNSRVMILNVNPAESAMGSLNPEACMNLMRRKMDLKGASLARRKSGGMLRAFFGPTSLPASRSVMLLVFRVLFGISMLYYGFISIPESAIFATATIIFGLLLIAGVATRFTSALYGAASVIMWGGALESGLMPVSGLIVAVLSLAAAFAGPGRYSLDAVIRRRIFRAVRRYETRKLMERRFSYRAYQYSHLL